jgi:sugar phosphate isomerase/epimerase
MNFRRSFLQSLGRAVGASLATRLFPVEGLLGRPADPAATGPAKPTQRFIGPFGLELYSVRNLLTKDIPGTLKMVQEVGYKEVEVVYDHWGHATERELRSYLDRAGLKCTSAFYPAERYMQAFGAVVDGAKALGVEYLVCGNVPGAFDKSKTLSHEDFRQAAKLFNEWASKLRAVGLRFAYHNHDYEFHLDDGKPAYDTLISGTQPGLVDFEIDVFWVKRGGQDPVAYLEGFPARFRLLHLKDMRKGTPAGDFSVGTSDEASVPLGEGILDMPAILRAGKRAGVERYYVEDESAEAPEGIRTSLHYLKQVRF